MKLVRGGKIDVKVNDHTGGVEQGDPLSPLWFNIIADGLASLIKKAQHEGRPRG